MKPARRIPRHDAAALERYRRCSSDLISIAGRAIAALERCGAGDYDYIGGRAGTDARQLRRAMAAAVKRRRA